MSFCTPFVDNAGRARIEGVEVEVTIAAGATVVGGLTQGGLKG